MSTESDPNTESTGIDEAPDPDAAAEQRLAAARLGSKVELRSIRLTRLDYESPLAVIEADTEVSVSIEVSETLRDPDGEQHALNSEEPTFLTYRLQAELACSGASGDVIRAEICFEMTYELLSGNFPTQDEIDAFGAVSAAFSGFPYVRELIQNLTVRSELPPLTLGVMRSPLDRDADT